MRKSIPILALILFLLNPAFAAVNPLIDVEWSTPDWSADQSKSNQENLLDLLTEIEASVADNELLWMLDLHFSSVRRLVEAYPPSSDLAGDLIEAFTDPEVQGSLDPFVQGNAEFLIAYDSEAGGVLSYVRCALPANWDPFRQYPLYAWPRGGGGTSLSNDVQDRFSDLTGGAVIGGTPSAVYKQGYTLVPGGLGGRNWNGADGEDFIEGIREFRSHFYTDPRHLYMGGFSNGGRGTFLMGARTMDEFNWAAFGMCAPAVRDSDPLTVDFALQIEGVPVWMAVGEDDNSWRPNTRTLRDLLTDAGIPPEHYHEEPGVGHEWGWAFFQDPMYKFLRSKEYIAPGGPPAAPGNLQVSSTSETSVQLSWTIPEGLEDAQIMLERRIGGDGAIYGFPWAYLPAGTASFTDTGLTPGTKYAYRVWGYDISGDTDYSNVVEITAGETSDSWAGWSMDSNGHVNTEGFLGWVTVRGDWIWNWGLYKYVYLPEERVQDHGAWMFVPR